jgi:pyruvate ferredoxin oxidoreductase gamma subunit
VREIRWHGRAGQGAKTASLLYASAMMRTGAWVQAFPEYGPERSGAPMRAYTRVDDEPVRRRYGITQPDAVVVLDPSLVKEVDPCAGLAPDGLLLVNSEVEFPVQHPGHIVWVPASRLSPGAHVNVLMLGALAAALGEPSLDDLREAAVELFGKKKQAALASAIQEIEAGFAAVGEVRWAA